MRLLAISCIECFALRFFPGQYYDQETGLYYNYFRTYDPGMGRYLESDPIGLEGGLNTYSYANSNSLINVDPYGLAYSPGGEHGLPPTDGCKPQEWAQCDAQCPLGVDGCYVSIKRRLKGIRGGNPIRVEERKVNCNCKEPPCPNGERWWDPIVPLLPLIPLFTPWPDPY